MGQGQNIRSERALTDHIRELNAEAIATGEQAQARADERACRWAAQILDCLRFRSHADHDISCGFKYAKARRFDVSRFHFNRAIAIVRKHASDSRTLTEIGQAFPNDRV